MYGPLNWLKCLISYESRKKVGFLKKEKRKKGGSEFGEKTLLLKEEEWPIFLVIYASF